MALEHVSAAVDACQRLGGLGSGRWRSAARDLQRLEDDLDRALAQSSTDLESHARTLGIQEEALWTAGEAAAELDDLRDDAIELASDTQLGAALLRSDLLYGVTFLNGGEDEDGGTTVVFGWPDPLGPAAWPWEANVVAAAPGEGDEVDDVLDIFESGDLAVSDTFVQAVMGELDVDGEQARQALSEASLALTRASLAHGDGEPEEDEEEGGATNGHV
jgi:hypothetical protein